MDLRLAFGIRLCNVKDLFHMIIISRAAFLGHIAVPGLQNGNARLMPADIYALLLPAVKVP